jgi:hypothetical protein
MFTTGVNSLNAAIAGYSLLIITIMGILIQLIRKPVSNKEGNSMLIVIKNVLLQGGPFFIILAIIGMMLYLLINYKNPIINNQVSSSFNMFSNITLFFILIIVYFIYNQMMCDGADCKGDSSKLDEATNSFLYLLASFAIISTGIVYTVLTFYRTDGFK